MVQLLLIFRNCELTFENVLVKREMLYQSFLLRHRTSKVCNAHVYRATRKLRVLCVSVVCLFFFVIRFRFLVKTKSINNITPFVSLYFN